MTRRFAACLVAIFCVCILVAAFSQSNNTKTISHALVAQTSGLLSDGTGGVFVSISLAENPTKPSLSCAGNSSAPNCLTVQAFDSTSGAFGQTEQVLQPGEFDFNTAKTLNSAMINVTLVSPGTFFDGVNFDLLWTANSPIIQSSTQQHMTGVHVHSSGTTRFATLSGTSSLTAADLGGGQATCCTWNGDAQISNMLNQTINIVKP